MKYNYSAMTIAVCPNCHKKLGKGDEKARSEVIEALRKNGVSV